jgi:hypothetical protein
MLQVSDRAAERMAHLLNAKSDDAVLRIIRREERLRMQFGQLLPGDQTFAHQGRIVLAIDQRIGKSLSLRHLELRETEAGPRLKLKTS